VRSQAACGVTLDVAKVSPTVIQADALLMEQAIANLLDNAIVYNQPGGSVRIELSPYDQGRRFRLTGRRHRPLV
jgi:signal transduction histidine kinase